MAKQGKAWPDYSMDEGPDDWSARELQNVADAAKAAIENVGPGLKLRDKTVSLRHQPSILPRRTLKIVAVVAKPAPESHMLHVREVVFETEGADFVPPETPTEPPTPVMPTPGTLRWQGNRFRALPGYTDSVADFASTAFDDIQRDENGTPVLVDGKAIEIPPDATTILHWLYLRPQGAPVLFLMGGGGQVVQQFRVLSIADGYVIGQEWDSKTQTAGSNAVIWMPWTLRVYEETYTFREFTYEYVNPQERIKRLPSGAFEEQIINLPYHGGLDGDIIYARFDPLGGIASSFPGDEYGQVPLTSKWVDTNDDGRAWAQKYGS